MKKHNESLPKAQLQNRSPLSSDISANTSASCEDSPIETIMKQQAGNFFVERNEQGELTYHWIDTRVEMLSSTKLWNILSKLETVTSELDQAFFDAITTELINRNDFVEGKPMPIRH